MNRNFELGFVKGILIGNVVGLFVLLAYILATGHNELFILVAIILVKIPLIYFMYRNWPGKEKK